MSNSLESDQAQHFVGPDLGPNCLQKLISRTRHYCYKLVHQALRKQRDHCKIHFILKDFSRKTCIFKIPCSLSEPFHVEREPSGSVVECLTRGRGAAGSSLTSVTALWSLSKA